MARGHVYPLADKALDGTLEARLRDARAAGESFDEIARKLHLDGVAISGETVRKWCLELGIEAS